MATLGYSPPVLFIPETAKSPQVDDYTPVAGHTGATVIQEADIVILSAGQLARAVTNQAANGTVIGYTAAAETAVFAGTTTAWTYGAYNLLPWGYSQVLMPPNPGQVPVLKLQGVLLDISLRSTNGWISGGTSQVVIGTLLGLFLDATSNLFVGDAAQGNTVMQVVGKPNGPGQGVAGDLAARVRVKFLGTALVGG